MSFETGFFQDDVNFFYTGSNYLKETYIKNEAYLEECKNNFEKANSQISQLQSDIETLNNEKLKLSSDVSTLSFDNQRLNHELTEAQALYQKILDSLH